MTLIILANRMINKYFKINYLLIFLKVPNIMHSYLLAILQTGRTGSNASCDQAGCDRSAVGPVLDGDVQSVG